jgi:hypothetical protein
LVVGDCRSVSLTELSFCAQVSAGGVAKRAGLKSNRSSSDSLRASPPGDDVASQRNGGSESDGAPAAKPKPKRASSGGGRALLKGTILNLHATGDASLRRMCILSPDVLTT